MKIPGKQITLALLELSFINEYLRQFSPMVRSWLHVRSLEDEKAYLQERLAKQQDDKTLFYCIFDNETHNLIGAIEIRDPFEHEGQLYCWLNEAAWGTKVFQEALNLALTDYFKKTKNTTLTARVDAQNERSYHALKKGGFADLGFSEGPHGKQYEVIFRKK